MIPYIVVAVGLAANVAAVVVLAVLFRRKRRDLSRRLRILALQVEDVRKGLRLEEIARSGTVGSTSGLRPRFTAQAGEDVLLYDYLKGRGPGFFVEAGAYDGVTFSNTYLFESLGWHGLLVEPHPRYAELCKANRPGSVVVQAALGPDTAEGEISFTCADSEFDGTLSFVSADKHHLERCKKLGCTLKNVSVPYCSLNALLEKLTTKVDLLSLDVEGMELDVLHGFDFDRYEPDVVLLEQHGNESDRKTARHMEEHGYHAVARKGCNVFFVPLAHRECVEPLLRDGERIGD